MADTRVSQKGTKTRTRAATHGRALVTDRRCPNCGCRHVIRCQSRGQEGKLLCGACGAFFDEEER